MADPVGGVVFDAEEAAGRRRRGLIIAAVVAAIGIPLALEDWWSTRQVEQEAQAVAAEVSVAADAVGDPVALGSEELLALSAGEPSPIDAALVHGERRRGVALVDGGFTTVYEVRHWLQTRCVHLAVTVEGVRTDIEDTDRCVARSEPR
ncbi:MAG: hypothetical protein ACLGIC_09255 [Acidimicrobiia bacterium]